jgi:hypothetical protein
MWGLGCSLIAVLKVLEHKLSLIVEGMSKN